MVVRRFWALALAACCSATSASAAIRIAVSFNYVETEASPNQGTYQTTFTRYYTLQGHSVHFEALKGANAEAQLGHAKALSDNVGDKFVRSVNIASKNTFVITNDYPTHVFKTTITTDGGASCTARREALLKPGQQYFEVTRTSNHERMRDSDVHFENVTCAITSQ